MTIRRSLIIATCLVQKKKDDFEGAKPHYLMKGFVIQDKSVLLLAVYGEVQSSCRHMPNTGTSFSLANLVGRRNELQNLGQRGTIGRALVVLFSLFLVFLSFFTLFKQDPFFQNFASDKQTDSAN